MNYVSPISYSETLSNFRGNYTNLNETEEEDLCPDASHHEWKKAGPEKAKCKHCGMVKTIAYGYEPEKSFEYGEENNMREGKVKKMSESRKKFERIKQGLSMEDQEQLKEYLDSLKEIKKTIKELLLKGSRSHSDSHLEETGGNMMHRWKKP